MQSRSSQAVGGNYIFRYSFGAAASMSALPIIKAIGVGWLSTISAGFLMFSAVLVAVTIHYGDNMMSWHGCLGKMSGDEEKVSDYGGSGSRSSIASAEKV